MRITLKNIACTFHLMACVIMFSMEGQAQAYEDIALDLGLFVNTNGNANGCGVSMHDFDRDGWDDLTVVQVDDSLHLYRNIGGSFELIPSPIYLEGRAVQPIWVDFDNDGDSDLFISRSLGTSILLRNDGDLSFTNISGTCGIPQDSTAESTGASWGDFDRDGWLDLYMCNFNWLSGAENWMLHNNQDGTFTEVAMDYGTSNGTLPSFQSSWLDHNHDLWPDLHVINDRNTGNAYFQNFGPAGFTDVSEEIDADLEMNSMSSTVGDYDNDGDLDIYITNNIDGNALLKNDGDDFEEVAFISGALLNMNTWAALWLDYDNNCWKDLFIASADYPNEFENQFLINDQGVFVPGFDIGIEDDPYASFSAAQGDLDRDGFPDFMVHNLLGEAYFYLNQLEENNSFTITLVGVESNVDGIGSWITTYLEEATTTHYTMCGSNYLGQDSQHLIISLGADLQADSVSIEWNSGQVDRHYDIPASSNITVVEGYMPTLDLEASSLALCEGESVMISASDGFDTYLWSTGDTSQVIEINTPGYYYVSSEYANGIPLTSDSVLIELMVPEVTIETDDVSCFGQQDGAISLEVMGGIETILWSNEQEGSELLGLTAGWYAFELTDSAGCSISDSVLIEAPQVLEADWSVENVLCFGDATGWFEWQASGGNGAYELLGQSSELTAGSYEVSIVDSLGCTLDIEFEVTEPDEIQIALGVVHSTGNDGFAQAMVTGGVQPYDILWSTEGTGNSAEGLEPGIYSVTVTDSNGCVSTMDFEIELVESIGTHDHGTPQVFPNPSTGWIDVSFIDKTRLQQLQIFDGRGRLVWKGSTLPVDVHWVSPGVYFLILNWKGGVRSIHEFVKE